MKSEATVKAERVWIAIGSGVGFAILETNDEKALYQLGVTWSDFGGAGVHSNHRSQKYLISLMPVRTREVKAFLFWIVASKASGRFLVTVENPGASGQWPMALTLRANGSNS